MCDTLTNCIEYMIEHIYEEIVLDDIAAAVGVSKFKIIRMFQKQYGMTPINFLWAFRTFFASEIIKNAPDWQLTDIAFRCGFNSSAHFSRKFNEICGTSARAFRYSAKRASGDTMSNGSYELVFEESEPLVNCALEKVCKFALKSG